MVVAVRGLCEHIELYLETRCVIALQLYQGSHKFSDVAHSRSRSIITARTTASCLFGCAAFSIGKIQCRDPSVDVCDLGRTGRLCSFKRRCNRSGDVVSYIRRILFLFYFLFCYIGSSRNIGANISRNALPCRWGGRGRWARKYLGWLMSGRHLVCQIGVIVNRCKIMIW